MRTNELTHPDAPIPNPRGGSGETAANLWAAVPPAGLPVGWNPPALDGDGPRHGAPTGNQTNGFAIASLVLGIISFVPLSIVFGVIALRQTRTTGQDGRGLAIAGLTLSGLWTAFGAVFALFIMAAVFADPVTVPPAEDTWSGSAQHWDAMQPGDCLTGVRTMEQDATVGSLPVGACSQPHDTEVVGRFELPDGPYPGDDAITDTARTRCHALLQGYARARAEDEGIQENYLVPDSAQTWMLGKRTVTCLAVTPSGTTTGSIRNP